jgi:hypothetical protein
LFAGKARKQPLHISISTAIPKNPMISGVSDGLIRMTRWSWRDEWGVVSQRETKTAIEPKKIRWRWSGNSNQPVEEIPPQ